MIKRPAPGDTEQDILMMQSDFLNEQFKDRSFQPAAKVVRVASTTGEFGRRVDHLRVRFTLLPQFYVQLESPQTSPRNGRPCV